AHVRSVHASATTRRQDQRPPVPTLGVLVGTVGAVGVVPAAGVVGVVGVVPAAGVVGTVPAAGTVGGVPARGIGPGPPSPPVAGAAGFAVPATRPAAALRADPASAAAASSLTWQGLAAAACRSDASISLLSTNTPDQKFSIMSSRATMPIAGVANR